MLSPFETTQTISLRTFKNELREVLHLDILTFYYRIQNGTLTRINYIPNGETHLSSDEINYHRINLAEIWLDHKDDLHSAIQRELRDESEKINKLITNSLKLALKQERDAFENRKKYLRKHKSVRALEKLRKQIREQELKFQQRSLFVEDEEIRERRMREQRWQLEEHERRINTMLDYVQREEKRIINTIIPKRYSVSHIDLQPVAVKITVGEQNG